MARKGEGSVKKLMFLNFNSKRINKNICANIYIYSLNYAPFVRGFKIIELIIKKAIRQFLIAFFFDAESKFVHCTQGGCI